MTDDASDGPITYVLRHLIIGGGRYDVPSSKVEFDALRVAALGIDEIVAIENAYAANIENFIELEKGVTALIVSNAVENLDIENYDDARRTAGRLVDNLLSSSRSFMDQCEKRLVKACGRAIKTDFDVLRARVKAESQAFRMMEVIRNHAQHVGTSVTSITMGMRREETEQDMKLIHTLSPLMQLKHLKADRKLIAKHPEAFAEIEALADPRKGTIDLMPLIRGYIEGLSAVLEGVRAILRPYEDAWFAADKAAFDRMSGEGRPQTGHAAVILQGNRALDSEDLSSWNIDRVKILRKRHRSLKHHTRFQLRH